MSFMLLVASILLTMALNSSIFPLPITNAQPTRSLTARTHHVSTTENWAGVCIHPPQTERFTRVIGTFTLPHVPDPSSSTGKEASFWVGFDGHRSDHILQAGVDCAVDKRGIVKFTAWTEWSPEKATFYDATRLDMAAGDQIEVEVNVLEQGTEGSITLLNKSNGKALTQSMRLQGGAQPIQGEQAEWIVENHDLALPTSGFVKVPFLNFGTVAFSDCYASTDKGTKMDLSQPSIYRLRPKGINSKVTDVDIVSGRGISGFNVRHL
ncbi:peptidase A4 family-domain-containing protein [Lentinula detonsa]|uniref:Peptidase A4 family-domain-containing protein n=1 Tax=Lentinula detonsa TaxID=2804962 RepID=A0AA38Q3G2_9AGAR|nr:peptidase A4 family-domain-containing protein [Lentinula detonsa]